MVRDALDAGDPEAANRLSNDLNMGIFRILKSPSTATVTLTPVQTREFAATADLIGDALAKRQLKLAQRLSTNLGLRIFRILENRPAGPGMSLPDPEAAPPTLTSAQARQLNATADVIKETLAKGDIESVERLTSDLRVSIEHILKPALQSTKAVLDPAQTEQIKTTGDLLNGALAKSDLETAQKLSVDLNLSLSRIARAARPTPDQKFHALESTLPSDQLRLYHALPKLAIAAFDAGAYDKAESYARQLLAISAGLRSFQSPGIGVFYGNMIVGRVALRRDNNVTLARSSLLAAGGSTGAPTLDSFGPNMSLAKDLIEAGERDVVLQYFTPSGSLEGTSSTPGPQPSKLGERLSSARAWVSDLSDSPRGNAKIAK